MAIGISTHLSLGVGEGVLTPLSSTTVLAGIYIISLFLSSTRVLPSSESIRPEG